MHLRSVLNAGCDGVEDSREVTVAHVDKGRGGKGDVPLLRQHHRHRLADIPHLVESEDRLVMKGRAVIGVLDDLGHVLAGQHRMDALDRSGRFGVDAGEHGVRLGAAHDSSV